NSESIEEVIELNDSDSEDEMMSPKEGGAFPAAALAAAVSFDLGSDTDDDAEEDDDKKGKESAAAAASLSGPGGKHERDDEEENEEDDGSDEEWQDEKKTYTSSGSQRRSKRDKGESERKRPPPPSSPEEYADVARERYESKEGFTFNSTRRPPANSSQHAVVHQFLNDFCVSIVMLLIARNLILLPVGILFGYINHASDLLSMNDGNPHIYYLFWPKRQGSKRRKKRDKIGCAGEGKKRYTYYWNEFKENMPAIISLLNINAIPACVQTLVTAAILKGLAAFVPDQLPVTIADATRLEMTGLPVCTTLFFWSMVKGFDECKMLGGGILMSGFLLRLYLTIIESGLQVLLKKGGDMHEAVNNSLMGFFFSAMREIWAAVLTLHGKLPETVFTEPQLLRPWLLSWAPGRLASYPESLVSAKVIIVEKISGGIPWTNAFADPPNNRPGNVSECYDTNQYSKGQKRVALDVILQLLLMIELFGGITAIDTNSLALSMSEDAGCLIELMLLRRPFGPNGPRWQRVFDFHGVTAMLLDAKGFVYDKFARLIFVFNPFWNAIFLSSREDAGEARSDRASNKSFLIFTKRPSDQKNIFFCSAQSAASLIEEKYFYFASEITRAIVLSMHQREI
ncbi:hypothetical protein THAOC_28278, partial [Thalassiosira oceanica]